MSGLHWTRVGLSRGEVHAHERDSQAPLHHPLPREQQDVHSRRRPRPHAGCEAWADPVVDEAQGSVESWGLPLQEELAELVDPELAGHQADAAVGQLDFLGVDQAGVTARGDCGQVAVVGRDAREAYWIF